MLYNAESNCLFIHIQKTAGTSITQQLCRKPGWTFVQPPHLLRRQVDFPGTRKPFTFAVIRNPWERLVSWWRMLQRKSVHNDFSRYMLAPDKDGRPVTFSLFMRRTGIIHEGDAELVYTPVEGLLHVGPRHYLKSIAFNHLDYLTDQSGRFAADRLLRFDQLQVEWRDLMEELYPLSQPEALPHVNAAPGNDDWRNEYASGADIDWVARLYARDISHFGFAFDARPA